MTDVAVVMGSLGDHGIMSKAVDILTQFEVTHSCQIVSAHRTPDWLYSFAASASATFKIIIAGAGGAAHLPGMVASLTTLPVIGVPIAVGELNGIDSVLSILQMPKGVPVATVAINGSVNAALLAVQILALQNPLMLARLVEYRNNMRDSVLNTKI